MLTVSASSCVIADEHVDTQPSASNKRAFLVGIGSYADGTGWGDLASLYDLKIVKAALEQQKFPPQNIHWIKDAEATREGIVDGFKRHLIEAANPGDVVVFHYSGHGHRLPDQNHDEIDGYDEVLVPYDALHSPAEDYDGSLHLRDDELGTLFAKARAAVGETGEVIAFIDSCYSGTIRRAIEKPIGGDPRGDLDPFGVPQLREDGLPLGLDQMTKVFEGAPGDPAPGRGSLTVFSASRYEFQAYQVIEGDRQIGSLSFALSRALQKAGPQTTYNALLGDMQDSLRRRVWNIPEIEGYRDTRIFGDGSVRQTQFHRVARIHRDSGNPILEGGPLVGLLPGTRVGLYPNGTLNPQSQSAIVEGTVEEGGRETESTVTLDRPVDAAWLRSSWAFVTSYPSGALTPTQLVLPASFDNTGWIEALRNEIAGEPLATISAIGEGEVILKQVANSNQVEIVAGDGRLLMPLANPLDTGFAKDVAQRLHDYAFNSWLRTWEFNDPDYQIRMDVVPCVMKRIANNERKCDRYQDTPAQSGEDWQIEDGYGLFFRNTGNRTAYFAVMDLLPNGKIDLLWPYGDASPLDSKLEPGDDFSPTFSYTIGHELGNELLLMVITREPVNFDFLRSRNTRAFSDLRRITTQKYRIFVVNGENP